VVKSETDKYRAEIENRIYKFGLSDTLKIKVEGWKDLFN